MKKIIILLCVVALLSGCSKARRATVDIALIYEPPQEKALISFVMGSTKSPLFIWDDGKMLGLLMPGSIFQYQATPGKHLFLGSFGNRVIPLEAELSPGKHYIVRSRRVPSVGFRFMPVRGDRVKPEQVQSWFDKYDGVQTDLTQFSDGYKAKRLKIIDRFIKHYIYSMYPEYTLKPEDSYDEPLVPWSNEEIPNNSGDRILNSNNNATVKQQI